MGAEHAARPGDTEEVFLDSRTPASSLFVHRNMIRHQLTRFPAELANEPDNRSCEEPSISEVIHEGGEVLDQETGFAKGAARELRATGERVGKRTTDTPDQLTARETQIARLAGEGLSNSMNSTATGSPSKPTAPAYISATTATNHFIAN